VWVAGIYSGNRIRLYIVIGQEPCEDSCADPAIMDLGISETILRFFGRPFLTLRNKRSLQAWVLENGCGFWVNPCRRYPPGARVCLWRVASAAGARSACRSVGAPAL